MLSAIPACGLNSNCYGRLDQPPWAVRDYSIAVFCLPLGAKRPCCVKVPAVAAVGRTPYEYNKCLNACAVVDLRYNLSPACRGKRSTTVSAVAKGNVVGYNLRIMRRKILDEVFSIYDTPTRYLARHVDFLPFRSRCTSIQFLAIAFHDHTNRSFEGPALEVPTAEQFQNRQRCFATYLDPFPQSGAGKRSPIAKQRHGYQPLPHRQFRSLKYRSDLNRKTTTTVAAFMSLPIGKIINPVPAATQRTKITVSPTCPRQEINRRLIME